MAVGELERQGEGVKRRAAVPVVDRCAPLRRALADDAGEREERERPGEQRRERRRPGRVPMSVAHSPLPGLRWGSGRTAWDAVDPLDRPRASDGQAMWASREASSLSLGA